MHEIVVSSLPDVVWGAAPRCEKCSRRYAAKTDSKGRMLCLHCARGLPETIKGHAAPLGRNQTCHCGSGKKFKKCCRGV